MCAFVAAYKKVKQERVPVRDDSEASCPMAGQIAGFMRLAALAADIMLSPAIVSLAARSQETRRGG